MALERRYYQGYFMTKKSCTILIEIIVDYRPESRQVSMYIIDAVFFGLALFMVIARIWTRAFIIKKFGPDDWFIVLALISVAGFTALQFCCKSL